MDGGSGARSHHIRIDDDPTAAGRLSRRRKLRVKREPYSFDYHSHFDSDSDSDDEGWLAYEASLLPGKRRCTAGASSSPAAANPVRLGHDRLYHYQAGKKVDLVVLKAATATPPNASLPAGTVPQPPVSAPASAVPAPTVPPNVRRAAPPLTGVRPTASSSYLNLMKPRRSTDVYGSVRPSSIAASVERRFASYPMVTILGKGKDAPLGKGKDATLGKGKDATWEKYGRDMTAEAGKMDPVIGRDDEIDRVVCILSRWTKNSAMLVGAPGVGKTAIAEGLAQRIAAGAVPTPLVGARVVEVDLGAMVAGTQYRGMFEERMKKVIQEAEAANGNVVLFIDEVHMLLGAGRTKGGSMDGANLLKPALARGRIRCIGATTFDEHRKYVEKDAAFERRFQKVHVQEPSVEATIDILQGLKKKYEEHHGAVIQDAAIVAAAQLANRYITGRQFPDKAIDLIDEACATARMQRDKILKGSATHIVVQNVLNEAIVSPSQVAEVLNRWTGIPVNTLNQDEKERLMHLADRLRERVVGQDAAVNSVAQAVLRSRAGLDQLGQPIGSFLFLGSTGVGKTELAKALAEQLFDSEKMLVRFDMSEFVGTHSVLRLIGAPPSYHGHEDGGQLTEKVRQRPYSVILFDEIEKADPAVFNVFLQLLDDGLLTDGKGRTVDFKNTIIIMTSNLGAEYLMEAISGEKTMEAARDLVIKQAKKHFRPEFLNRLSELVVFEPLSQDKRREVANIHMKGIISRAANKGITLSASDAALDVILSESDDPHYGARPIRRWLQKNVMTKLSEMLFKGEIDADTSVIIDASDDKKCLKYEVVKNLVTSKARRRQLVEIPSDSDCDDDGVKLTDPIAKKLKGKAISSSGE